MNVNNNFLSVNVPIEKILDTPVTLRTVELPVFEVFVLRTTVLLCINNHIVNNTLVMKYVIFNMKC